MIIASVVPSMIHGYEKRKREREWQAAADLALKKSSCVENEYEMQPMKAKENEKDEEESEEDEVEPNEETAFLAPANPSLHEENENLQPLVMQDFVEKPDDAEECADDPIEDDLIDGDPECELEYDPTDLNLNASYEDLGSSFATEMAALMSNYDYISPKKEPPECPVPRESEEDMKREDITL